MAEQVKELCPWDFECKQIYRNFCMEDEPIFTPDNFIILLNSHIELVKQFNSLVESLSDGD